MIRSPGGPLRPLAFALACLAAVPLAAFAQGEPAVTKRAAELRETPAESGRSLASLPAQSAVTRLGDRQGAWVQVKSAAGQTGWVHMFEIGPAQGVGSAGSGTGVLRGVTGLFTRGSAQPVSSATSTIGIRGLGAEDLNNAQPDLQAVDRMEGLRQTESQARQFGNGASLKSNPVEPLPAPARARPSGGDPAATGQMP